MDITIFPSKLSGALRAIPSKSQAHRLLICAAFADGNTELICPETNQDIEATANCLNALGASVCRTDNGYHVTPASKVPGKAVLDCRESGSTLRFLLPIVGALGVEADILLSGRLPDRPLSPLWEEMERMGCHLSRPEHNRIHCCGQLRCGAYSVPGNVSSQYVSGLLFALTLMNGVSELSILGKLESKPYVDMTKLSLSAFGANVALPMITGCRTLHTPGRIEVEGDWSNAAFFLAAQALGSSVTVTGLNPDSPQGDRAVSQLLDCLSEHCHICATDIPDLVPILAVVAGTCEGAVFTDIARLRLKESDRVETTAAMLRQLGASIEITENTLKVFPAEYQGCIINAAGDHRIAMAAAIAVTVSTGPVTILGAECVAKSYPSFWEEYRRLGGKYEQYIR